MTMLVGVGLAGWFIGLTIGYVIRSVMAWSDYREELETARALVWEVLQHGCPPAVLVGVFPGTIVNEAGDLSILPAPAGAYCYYCKTKILADNELLHLKGCLWEKLVSWRELETNGQKADN